MESGIRELCAISVICGLLYRLTPEGSARRAMSFVCSVVILACVADGVRGLDLDVYALELSQNREREQAFLARATETRDALDRMVIEREYAAYILDTARQQRIPLQSAEVLAEWSVEGLWVPYSVKLYGTAGKEERQLLGERIQADLGIPRTRQEWTGDG